MGRQFDLFERAAACASLMKDASDPAQRQILKHLRELWISLAHEEASFSTEGLAAEVERLEQIQAMLRIPPRTHVH
jgi:hypothetical protein